MAAMKRARLTPEALRGCKPVKNPAVTEEAMGEGVVLSGPAPPSGVLVKILARAAGKPLTKKFELEEVGAHVWKRIDGKQSFEGLSRSLQTSYKMNRVEADASLAAFLQILSQKGLISILVKK